MFAAFNVKVQKEFDPVLVLTDNLNMPVKRDQFSNIVKTFHAGSMFYLNAEFQPTNIKGACVMVTPMVNDDILSTNYEIFLKISSFVGSLLQMLENYLVHKNKGCLLACRTSKTLDSNTFHLICNELADFAVDAFGFQGITTIRKNKIARAAVSLFDAMKYKDSLGDGTVRLCVI